MIRIYIIGSLSDYEYICKTRDCLDSIRVDFVVKCVVPQPDKELSFLIDQAYENILASSIVIAVSKSDGTYGDGTLYEIEFARVHNIPVIRINRHFSDFDLLNAKLGQLCEMSLVMSALKQLWIH